MIDAHNHLHQFADPGRMIAEMQAVGIRACVVNGTSEDDWPAVAALAERYPGFVHPAFGLHPWHAHRRSPRWLDRLAALLDRFPAASIGECGVDRWVDEPAMTIQREVFVPQLALARERRRPISIHALQAWGPLIEALKVEPPPESGFLLHAFGGTSELVAQLAPLGARFSFSGYFLHPRKAQVLAAFAAVPPDRLLLETDAPSMTPPDAVVTHPLADSANHPANLPSIARSLAGHLDEPFDALARRTDENTRRFFGIVSPSP